MAVEIIILGCFDGDAVDFRFMAIVGHAIAHLPSDIVDEFAVYGLDFLEFFHYKMELDEEVAVFLIWAVAVVIPAIFFGDLVELSEQRVLFLK